GEMGSSMMACADPVMAQERALLDILEATTGFSVADDGTLTLAAADGRSLVASRSVP
ncbi:MAG: META domain-containing protein, partial [Rhizobiales bacterium]|nr:META domain-containing protein [Hyphomicrobiales bacterium]